MKYILTILLCLPAVSLADFHSSCDKFLKGTQTFMTITKSKSSLNVLHLAVDYDSKSCEFTPKSNVIAFWVMGHSLIGGKPSCEYLLDKEIKKMFGFNSRVEMDKTLSEYHSSGLMEVLIPKLPEYPSMVGNRTRVNEIAKLELTKVNGKCSFNPQMLIDSSYHRVDRMHLGIKYLPPFISHVNLYSNSKLQFSLQ